MYEQKSSHIRSGIEQRATRPRLLPRGSALCLYDFARRNGFDVVKEFEDIETAKSTGRKDFGEMLEYVKEREIKYILVEKTDRLHRNFKDFVLIEELTEQNEVTVFFVKEGSSIGKHSRSSEKFMHNIRVVMAKNFIDNLSEEVNKGIDVKLSQGEYPRQAPIGYLNGKDPLNPKHNIVVVDPDSKVLVQKIFEYYSTGMYSLKSLIERLNDEGLAQNLPPIIKSGKLYTSLISRTLANPFYIGKFLWKGKIIQGSHDPIVSVELWEKVQEITGSKNKNWRKEHNVIPFMFKGVFTCGVCGRTVTAEKKKGKYIYYHCTQYKTKCGQPFVREKVLAERFAKLTKLLQISNVGVDFVAAGLKKSLGDKREWQDKAFDQLVVEQKMLRKRLDNMYEDRLDKKISDTDYDRRFSEYSTRLEKIDEKITRHNKSDINYYEFGRKILELAENAEMLLKEAEPDEKRELVQYFLSNSKLKDAQPEFSLKTPFSSIEKRSPCDDRLSWQGCRDSNPE